VFAKQKLSPSDSRGLALPCVLLAFLFACFPSPSRADSLEDAARTLALKVCASDRQPALEIRWQDAVPAHGALSDAVRNSFLAQLSACGIDTAKKPGIPSLTVSVQWTASKVLLMADSENSAEPRRVEMVELPRPRLSLSNESSSGPHLARELIWQQERPINSAVEWYDRSNQQQHLFLLSEGFLIRRRLEDHVWTLVDSTELPSSARSHRLGKGEFVHGDHSPTSLAFLLDDKICSIQLGERVSFTCSDTNIGGKVVTMASACAEKFQILATGRGDYTQQDRITLARTEPIRPWLSEAEIPTGSVELPGPVLDDQATEDRKSVTAVVRNLSTGIYEVYRITAVCGN
jgi:hypothetical protein